MDVEAKARAIADAAKQGRKRPSRAMWIAAGVVAVVCVAALASGYWERPRASRVRLQAVDRGPRTEDPGSGFGTGLLLGLGAGIAIGGALALRKRP